MAGKDPQRKLAYFDLYYMLDGVPELEASVTGNTGEHRSNLKKKEKNIARSPKVFAYLTFNTSSLNEASMAVLMLLITARLSTGMLVRWVHILSSLCCQTISLGFCLSFTLVNLKLWIYLYYPTTGSSSMCTAHSKTIK
jgi:hypothetical protein